MGRPENSRVMVTNVVSKIGTSRRSTGTSRTAATPREEGNPPRGESPARKKRRKKLPAAPIKIRAGGKFLRRKPKTAPMKTAEAPAPPGFPSQRKKTRRKPPAINAIPAERPSMLSSRLKAFVIPTIQKSVRKTSRRGIEVRRRRKPK